MTNIFKTLNQPNTNVLPARKLTKGQGNKNVQIDYVPQPLYKYSFHDAIKTAEQRREQIDKDVYQSRIKKRKKDKTFPIILGLVTGAFIFLQKKVIK